jgi:hypothetical protein
MLFEATKAHMSVAQKVYVCDGPKPSKTGGESARKMKAEAKAFLTSTDSARVTRAAPPERCELATNARHGLTQTAFGQKILAFSREALLGRSPSLLQRSQL